MNGQAALPLGVLAAGLALVRGVGGAGFGVVRTTGEVVLELLDEAIVAVSESPVSAPQLASAQSDDRLASRMEGLLSRALEQSTKDAREDVFHHILDMLVPDEARILSALSDGSRSPMVSVHGLNASGLLGEALIEHACLVGRTANVAMTRLTPVYVRHLLALGLVEVGPEDSSLKDEYQVLLAETDVLAAVRLGSRGPVPARVVRRTLRISALGRALWHACTGDEE